jgi:hypothetical protein
MYERNPNGDVLTTPGIDASTKATLFRFGLMVGTILVFLIFDRSEMSQSAVASALMLAALFACMGAAKNHEQFCAPALNRWDEMLAYLGLSCLAAAV